MFTMAFALATDVVLGPALYLLLKATTVRVHRAGRAPHLVGGVIQGRSL
jgi:hypothetical protein